MSIIDNFKATVSKAADTWTKRLQDTQAANIAARKVDPPVTPPASSGSIMFDSKSANSKLPSVTESPYGFFPNTELRSPTVAEKLQTLSGPPKNPNLESLKTNRINYEESPYVKALDSEWKNASNSFGEKIDSLIAKPNLSTALNAGYSAVTTSISSSFAPVSAGFKSLEALPGGKQVNEAINYVPAKIIEPFVQQAMKPIRGENQYFTDLKQNFLAPMFNTALTLAYFEKAAGAGHEVLKTYKEVLAPPTEIERARWDQMQYDKAWQDATGKKMPSQVGNMVKTALKVFPNAKDIIQRKFTEATDNIKKGVTEWKDKPDQFAMEVPNPRDFDKYKAVSNVDFKTKGDMILLRERGVNGKVVGVENMSGQRQIFDDNTVSAIDESTQTVEAKKNIENSINNKINSQNEVPTQTTSDVPTEIPTTKVPSTPKATEVAAPEISSTESNPIQKITGLSKSIEAKSIEDGLTKGFSDLSGYTETTLKVQAEMAKNIVETDYEQAKRIATGEEPAPKGVVPTSVFKAVEIIARREGDIETLQKLSSSKLTKDVSGAGQLLSILQDRDKESPISAMKDLSDTRKRISEKRTKVSADKQVSKVKGEIRDSIKKTSVKVSDWSSFIDSIKCV